MPGRVSRGGNRVVLYGRFGCRPSVTGALFDPDRAECPDPFNLPDPGGARDRRRALPITDTCTRCSRADAHAV